MSTGQHHHRNQSLYQRLRHNKGFLAVSISGTIMAVAFFPVWYKMTFVPKQNMDDPFPRSAGMRGAYVNSGSRDIGPDRPVPKREAKQEQS